MQLNEIVLYLDELLDTKNIKDSSINGLQVENEGIIEEIYSGVDICCELVEKSPEKSLIIVHHGLLWKDPTSGITGDVYKIVKKLCEDEKARKLSGEKSGSLVEENRGATEKIVNRILSPINIYK